MDVRKKTQHKWIELQDTCAYHGSFSQEKLFLPQLAHQGRCVLVDQSVVFCINNASIITGRSLKFLCAILNSQLITWFVHRTAKHWGDAGAKWLRTTIRTIPVPVPSNAVNESFARQVNRNHEANAPNSGRKDTRWVDQVDSMVYSLYGIEDYERDAVAACLGQQ